MECHYFELARSARRVLFRENEYTSVARAGLGPGFILTCRSGAEFRVTSSHPKQIDRDRLQLAPGMFVDVKLEEAAA